MSAESAHKLRTNHGAGHSRVPAQRCLAPAWTISPRSPPSRGGPSPSTSPTRVRRRRHPHQHKRRRVDRYLEPQDDAQRRDDARALAASSWARSRSTNTRGPDAARSSASSISRGIVATNPAGRVAPSLLVGCTGKGHGTQRASARSCGSPRGCSNLAATCLPGCAATGVTHSTPGDRSGPAQGWRTRRSGPSPLSG
jgi:hypothetical protein